MGTPASAVPIDSVPSPPRARSLPLLGSVPFLSRDGLINFAMAEWKRLGDVFRMQVGPRTLVALAIPEAIERVLASNRENYVKGKTYDGMRLLTGDGLLTLEGDAWLQRRKMEQPAFHRESIRKLTAVMTRVTDETLQRWRTRFPQGGTFEAHQEMLRLTLEVVGETLFGQPLGEANTEASGQAFTDALHQISSRSNSALQLPLSVPTPGNLRFKKALKLLDEQVYRIIANARAQKDHDARPSLLGMLLDAKDASGQGLTDRELRNEVITLFLAGHETTALLLTWGFTLLGKHPEVVAKMRTEVDTVLGGRLPTTEDIPKLSYVRQVVDEILRLRSPTFAVARDTVADDVLAGFRVRAGEVVVPMSYLAHRHPKYWENPDAFVPERFAPENTRGRNQWAYFPFSLGPRMCIGNVFSLVESQVVLSLLLQRTEFELVPGVEAQPDAQITLRPTAPVNVRFRWRS